MILNLKELIVLKEKLKNTYAYQNSKKLKFEEKGKAISKRTEEDLVYELVKFLEEYIERKTKTNAKLNDDIIIVIKDIQIVEEVNIDIPEI